MKTLFFYFLLIIGIFNLNIANAQKISKDCTPKVPFKNWDIFYNSPTGDDIDFSKIKFKLNPIKEGTDFSSTFKKEAEIGINACYLDFFLENKKLIPDDWKNITIIFTGTVFQEDKKYLVYKTLFYNRDRNDWVEGKNYAEFILGNTSGVSPLLN